MIGFACMNCGKRLKAPAELAGKKVKCPTCGKAVPVPAAAPSSSARGASRSATFADEPKSPPSKAPPASKASTPSSHDAPTLPPGENAAAGAAGGDKVAPGDTVPGAANQPQATASYRAEWTEFLAPAQAADEIGRLGVYRILSVLGAGGMGVVFKAEDPHLNRPVALKAMLPALAATGTARERFKREAQAAAAIDHDHIVHIYQVSEDRGIPYIAMQLLQGEPLDQRLKRERIPPLAEILRISRETAEGLAAAHARGLIHRDIKPANIWLESKGAGTGARADKGTPDSAHSTPRPPRVKILDFGLARNTGGETHLTQQGSIVGTPAYMAPEQATGEKIDARCDLFSLGCVLYRLCTGDVPFKGTDTIAILVAVATDKPKPPRELNADVPPALSDLIMQLLEKKPELRPASATSVVHALQAIEADNTAHLPSGTASGVKSGLQRRIAAVIRPRLAWWIGGAAILAGSAGLLFLLPRLDQNNKIAPIRSVKPLLRNEWVALFNGKDLAGWKKHPDQTRGNWNLTGDGLLEGRGGGNYLFSERGHYENFHLRVEAKIANGTNAGLFIRSPFELGFDLRILGGQGKMPAGYEVEIVSPATDPDVPTGSIWKLTAKPDVIRAAQGAMADDSWFVLEAIARGSHLVTKINEKVVAERSDRSFSKGHIVLQVLSDPGLVQFRRIEIKDLPEISSEDTSPAAKPCPADSLKRDDIPLELLKAAGGGDAAQAPRELVAIIRLPDAELVNVAAVSPDGKWLALGSATTRRISVLDLATAKERHRFSAADAEKLFVAELAFSPDSKRLATSTSAGRVRIWDVDSGTTIGETLTTGPSGAVYTMAFSPDDKTLAVARLGKAESVKLFDLSGKDFETRALPFVEQVTALAFSPDGQTLACGTARAGKVGASLQFWDVTTGKKKLAPLKDLAQPVVRMRFYADGKRLVYACAATPECYVLNVATRNAEKIAAPAGHATFALSHQGTVATAANKDSRIFLWNPAVELKTRQLNLAPADIVPRHVRFTPEGRHLVTVNSDGGVYVLRLAPPAEDPVTAGPPDVIDPEKKNVSQTNKRSSHTSGRPGRTVSAWPYVWNVAIDPRPAKAVSAIGFAVLPKKQP
jgi:serine/threonine protein kinase/WD40 repeat protein